MADTQPPIWCIMPIAGAESYTDAAILDLLAQSVPTRILLINQGIETPFREHLEQICEQNDNRVFLWNHDPCLPSLSMSWNLGLRFAWNCGGTEALVVNNDVRLHQKTVDYLHGMLGHVDSFFISAVGVTEEQFEAYDGAEPLLTPPDAEGWGHPVHKGGPDFSCFLLSKAGHEKYPFDENFVPAYCEDLDMHRRYMLGGDGDKIFSINLPYLHFASGTLKSFSDEQRAHWQSKIGQSRAYYEKKWGGPVNGERYTIPFEPKSAQDGVTTPDLQRACQGEKI